MEGQQPPGGEDKNKDETLGSRKERGFLSSWIERIRQSNERTDDDNKEDDEPSTPESRRPKQSEEKEKEPGGRWERFFKRIFPQVVERPQLLTETASADAGNDTETEAEPEAFATIPNEIVLPPPPHIEQNNQVGAEIPDETAAEDVTDNSIEQDVIDVVEAEDGQAEGPEDEPLAGEINDTAEIDIPEEEAEEEQPAPAGVMHLPPVGGATPAERVVYQRQPAEADRKPAPEVVIRRDNKGIAVAAGLVGAEFLGRRRADRKIKKEVKDLRKETAEQKKASDTLREAHLALERKAAAAMRQPERKSSPKSPERVKPPQPARTEARTPAPEAKKASPVEKTPDVKIESRPPKEKFPTPEAPPFIETKTEKQAEALPEAPKKIFEKVAIAAERDLPIEKLYERRHEIKDEPTISDAAGAVSVGTVLSQMNLAAAADTAAVQPSGSAGGFSERSVSSYPVGSDMYRQAIRGGFWAAVVLLIFVGVAALTLS